MSNFILDPKDAKRVYKLAGEQLVKLLANAIKFYSVYRDQYNEPDEIAKLYAINEAFLSLDKGKN